MTLSQPVSASPAELAVDFVTCVGVFEDEFDFVHNALRRHGISESDAEDLVQEVFLVMWRRWSQFDRTRPMRPWLAGIAFRVAYNHRQRVGREVPIGFVDREDETPDPEERLQTDKARSLVRRVLGSLPEKHRFLIVAHDVDGTSVREIAEWLGIPVPTAHTRLRAARKAFAKSWKQLIAVSVTKARLRPLLLRAGLSIREDGEIAGPVIGDERGTPDVAAVNPAAKRRATDRVRALAPWLSLPTGSEGLVPGVEAGPRFVPRPSVWKAFLPVAGSFVVGGLSLSAAIGSVRSSEAASDRTTAGLSATHADSIAPSRSATLNREAVLPPEWTARSGRVADLTSTTATTGNLSLANGLVAYWRFDESPGNVTVRDWSGNGNDCHLRQLDAATAWGEGRLGGAITLPGGGWLECPKVEAVERLERKMTISLWVRRSGTKGSVRALVTRQFGDRALDAFHLGFRDDDLALRSRVKGGLKVFRLFTIPYSSMMIGVGTQ